MAEDIVDGFETPTGFTGAGWWSMYRDHAEDISPRQFSDLPKAIRSAWDGFAEEANKVIAAKERQIAGLQAELDRRAEAGPPAGTGPFSPREVEAIAVVARSVARCEVYEMVANASLNREHQRPDQRPGGGE